MTALMNTMMTMLLLMMNVTIMILATVMAMVMVVTVVLRISLITLPSAARPSHQRHWRQGNVSLIAWAIVLMMTTSKGT